MDVNRFLNEHKTNWERMEFLLQQIEQHGVSTLRANEAREFGVLYRLLSSDLVQAQTTLRNAELLEYLNDLVARGYSEIYGAQPVRVRGVKEFLLDGFPRLAREQRGYILAAALILLSGGIAGFVATLLDPSATTYLLPPQYAHMRPTPNLQRGGFDLPPDRAAAMSMFIMTNNIKVSFGAFALGITAGVGTVYLLFFNGLLLGCLGAMCMRWKMSLGFWALILPHGVLELTCITIAGGSGLLLGSALIAPHPRTRAEALQERGLLAVKLVLGSAALLVLAALIESFITPVQAVGPYGKLGFAAFTALGLAVYFRRR